MSTARNGGIQLAFDVEGSGPDLLLIVGAASTRPLWRLVRSQLATSFRTIAFDNRDSGESTIVSETYTFSDLARDALAVLDAAGSRHAHIVGHSLGGVVAQELALRFPHRCRSLTLACTWGRGDTYARTLMELMRALAQSDADDRTLLAALLWAGAGETTLQEIDLWERVDAALALGALAPRAALLRQWDLAMRADTLDRLGSLQLPAHAIWCSEDRLLPPRLSQQLADALANAARSRIDRCGHLPMVDRPDAFVRATLAFLHGV